MTVERENSISNSRLGQQNENTNGADASREMQLAEAIAIMVHYFDNTDAPPDAKKIIPTPTTPMRFRNSARRKCCAGTLTDNPTMFAY